MPASANYVDPQHAPVSTAPRIKWYLATIIFTTALVLFYVFSGYTRFAPITFGYNIFAPIALEGNPNWYRDFGGRHVPEIQDEESFYHNVGGAVAAARTADIAILGPSFVSYAFDRETLHQFGEKNGLKIYNMSFIGIRGGEFSLKVIERWHIRPKLWIINVDDQVQHFFSRGMDLTLGPHVETIPATQHGRWRGFLNVISQNLRWRAEDWMAGGSTVGISRNIENGDIYLDSNPTYVANDNTEAKYDRDRPSDCHASLQQIEIARNYIQKIGGQVVFTLVPHGQACPQQARELAAALGVELIIAPLVGYTYVDAGGHLDKKSAIKFSNYFFSALSQTNAFKRAKAKIAAGEAK